MSAPAIAFQRASWLFVLGAVAPGCTAPGRHGNASPPAATASTPTTGQPIQDGKKWLEPEPPEPPATRGTGEWSAYRRELDAWLEPPSADQPQPKFVCARPEVRVEPVWYGQRVAYTWEIANEGRAPLRIHLLE